MRAALGAVVALCALTACSSTTDDPTPPPSAAPRVGVTLPPTTGGFDYQLGGPYRPPGGVTVLERDSTAAPAPGIYSICYVNGFQTQPGVAWPDDLILNRPDGSALVDPGWPDEHLVDISTAAKRAAAADRQQATIALCAQKGFRAVEFDNLDSYTRSRGGFDVGAAVDFATMLTARAHRAGLAVAQKNTAELARRGRDDIGFDFAVTEECGEYDECASFTSVYGPYVYDIEYAEECPQADTPPMTILRDHDLTTPTDDDYRYHRC